MECPDREIVKYLSFEPDFENESPPRQGLIESTENWDNDVVIDYDPNIQVEKFRKIAEEADKEGYIAPTELPIEINATSPAGLLTENQVEQVEINGAVIKIKREKTENEEANEDETMALLEEQLKEPEVITAVVPPLEPRRYDIRVKKEWSPIRRRSPSPPPRRRTPPPRRYSPLPPPRRSLSTRKRSPSPPRRRSPSPPLRRRSPSSRRMSPPLRRRSPSPLRRRSPSPRRRSPSPRRRSPGYYRMLSPAPRPIKREPDDNGYLRCRDRFDTSRRYEGSPPPVYRVKEEFNGKSSRHDPYARYEEEHSRKSKYDEYYARKPEYYEEKSSKDLYPSKYDDYERRSRYDERRRSPSPKAYPAAYRPRSRSRSPRFRSGERARSRSGPRSASKYDKERSPRYEREAYDRRKTPPLAPPKSSKDYYDYAAYGKEKEYRKISERRVKAEKYSPPRAYKLKESRKSPEVADEEMIYSRQP